MRSNVIEALAAIVGSAIMLPAIRAKLFKSIIKLRCCETAIDASMVKRSEIVKEALSWSNTPWHHHQGVKGVGTDCVQFVLGVGKEVGFIPKDYKIENYEPLARGSFLIRKLEEWLIKVEEFNKGSILLINENGLDTHVGIVTDGFNFIHASAKFKAVVLSPIYLYKNRIKWIYDVPEVIDG